MAGERGSAPEAPGAAPQSRGLGERWPPRSPGDPVGVCGFQSGPVLGGLAGGLRRLDIERGAVFMFTISSARDSFGRGEFPDAVSPAQFPESLSAAGVTSAVLEIKFQEERQRSSIHRFTPQCLQEPGLDRIKARILELRVVSQTERRLNRAVRP